MLVIQKICGKRYECTVSVFKAALSRNTGVLCTQESFLEKKTLRMRDLIYIGQQELKIVRIIIFILRLKNIYSIKQLWKTELIWSITTMV